MLLDRYEVEISRDNTIYEFVSKGEKGDIKKIVRYSDTNLKDFFNLGFGDFNEKTGQIDDKIVTDNGDSEKVLATVAATLYAFTAKNIDSWIYIEGSTIGRTRLYRMAISKYLNVIQEDFIIMGLVKKSWKPFIRNQEYQGFAIKRYLK
jgi:hypothetical protein